MPPLDASFGLRFLNPRATCAVCGREVDPGGCPIVAATKEPEVEVSVALLGALASVVPGELLVICRECQASQV